MQCKILLTISNSRKCAARVKALSTLQQKLARVLDKGRNENISGVQFNKDIFQLPRANPFNFFPPSLQPGLSHEFEFLVRAKTQLEVATKGTTHCYISPVPTSAFIRPDMSFSSAGNMFQPPQCLFISDQKFVYSHRLNNRKCFKSALHGAFITPLLCVHSCFPAACMAYGQLRWRKR